MRQREKEKMTAKKTFFVVEGERDRERERGGGGRKKMDCCSLSFSQGFLLKVLYTMASARDLNGFEWKNKKNLISEKFFPSGICLARNFRLR